MERGEEPVSLAGMAEAATGSPAMVRLAHLVEWVQSGRRLTAEGDLRSADLLAASRAIRADRHVLADAWTIARGVGLVETEGGVAYQSAAFLAWAELTPEDRLAIWRDAFAFRLGIVRDARAIPNLRDGLPVVLALNCLYQGNTPPTPAWLGAMLAHVLPTGGPRLGFDYPVDAEMGTFVVEVLTDYAVVCVAEGQVVLTAQGRWLVNEIGPRIGYRDLDLARGHEHWRTAEKNPTLEWIESHTPYEVAVEFLGRAAAHDAYKRVAALQVVQSVGPVGKRAWQAYADLPPPVGPHARKWLAEHGEPVTLSEHDEAWIAADRFVAELCTAENSEESGEALLRRIPPADLRRIRTQLDTVDHPDADMVRQILAAFEEDRPG